MRAFLDASVLYSAIASSAGASRELLRRHLAGDCQLVVSEYVLEETRRNLANKFPSHAGTLDVLIDVMQLETVSVTRTQIEATASYTELKDAPVVAATIAGKCDYLLTFDRQHLLGNTTIEENAEIKIRTVGDFLQLLREES